MPWDDLLQTALGMLGWKHTDFWDATFYEYLMAVEGYAAKNGFKPKRQTTRNEFLDIRDKVRENERRMNGGY